jgi:hypothetical protein
MFVDKIFDGVDGLFVKGQTSSALNLGAQTTALSETFGKKHTATENAFSSCRSENPASEIEEKSFFAAVSDQ